MRLYANRIFAAASLTTFALGAALFGAMILVPLYYQQVRGESVIVTGLLVGPQGLGMLMVAPFVGPADRALRRRPRRPRRRLDPVPVLAAACVHRPPTPRSCGISLALALRGVGIGLSFIPVTTVAFAALRTDQLSDATPQMNVLPARRRRDRHRRARGRPAARERGRPDRRPSWRTPSAPRSGGRSGSPRSR